MDPYSSLSHVDTTELLIAAQQAAGQERALLEEGIVRNYLPMARRLASHFCTDRADLDDLIQVANIALVKAIRGFDQNLGVFEPYAKATISGELKKYLRDHCWSIKPPRRVQELQAQIARTTEDLTQSEGQTPGLEQLADAMELSVEAISEAVSARSCYSPASLDRPTGVAGRPLGDNIADEQEPYALVDGCVSLVQICSDLSEEDLTLIRLRFYECLSQREIAAEIGVSQMQVSRRLARLIEHLRAKAASMEMLEEVSS